jgi:ribose-phosphate pyrophosphokinase
MKDVEDKSGRGTILLPDEGAVGRYDNLPWPTLNATKKRDPLTGKLSGFEVPPISKFGEGPILIVDDICDGGGTFLGIAKELGNSRPLYLYTTHGIFSKGFVDLRAMFKRIYTTDSVRTDLQSEFLTVYDAFSLFQ